MRSSLQNATNGSSSLLLGKLLLVHGEEWAERLLAADAAAPGWVAGAAVCWLSSRAAHARLSRLSQVLLAKEAMLASTVVEPISGVPAGSSREARAEQKQ